jgi:hypothetical protein
MSTVTRIETSLWEPDPERPGYLRHVRDRTIDEVYDLICEQVGPYPDGAEEYFSVSAANGVENWPVKARIAIFAVEGSSEGDYVHVEALNPDRTFESLFLGKTFAGRDAAWGFARRLADILNPY